MVTKAQSTSSDISSTMEVVSSQSSSSSSVRISATEQYVARSKNASLDANDKENPIAYTELGGSDTYYSEEDEDSSLENSSGVDEDDWEEEEEEEEEITIPYVVAHKFEPLQFSAPWEFKCHKQDPEPRLDIPEDFFLETTPRHAIPRQTGRFLFKYILPKRLPELDINRILKEIKSKVEEDSKPKRGRKKKYKSPLGQAVEALTPLDKLKAILDATQRVMPSTISQTLRIHDVENLKLWPIPKIPPLPKLPKLPPLLKQPSPSKLPSPSKSRSPSKLSPLPKLPPLRRDPSRVLANLKLKKKRGPPKEDSPNDPFPDAIMYLRNPSHQPTEKEFWWFDTAACITMADSEKEYPKAIEKTLLFMQRVMAIDPCRRFTYGISLTPSFMNIWFHSRNTLTLSGSFQFNELKDFKKIIKVISSLVYASKEDLGWDPTISVSIKPLPYTRIFTYEVAGEKFETEASETEASSWAFIGSGTRLCKGRRMENGEPKEAVVIKDFWPDDNTPLETHVRMSIIDSIHNDKDRIFVDEHILKPMYHEAVKIGKREDHTKENILRGGQLGYDHFYTELEEEGSSFERNQDKNIWKALPDRYHYRIVYRTVTPIRRVYESHDIITVLIDVLKALHIIHLEDWVHGDISTGNIYLDQDPDTGIKRGVLGYLEHCKVAIRGNRSERIDFTPGFGAVELYHSRYLFTSKEKNYFVPRLFHYNYLHDIESLWWTAIRAMIDFEERRRSGGSYHDPENRLKRTKEDAFLNVDKDYRLDFFEKDGFDDLALFVPEYFEPLRKALEIARNELLKSYREAEAGNCSRIHLGKESKLHQVFIEALQDAKASSKNTAVIDRIPADNPPSEMDDITTEEDSDGSAYDKQPRKRKGFDEHRDTNSTLPAKKRRKVQIVDEPIYRDSGNKAGNGDALRSFLSVFNHRNDEDEIVGSTSSSTLLVDEETSKGRDKNIELETSSIFSADREMRNKFFDKEKDQEDDSEVGLPAERGTYRTRGKQIKSVSKSSSTGNSIRDKRGKPTNPDSSEPIITDTHMVKRKGKAIESSTGSTVPDTRRTRRTRSSKGNDPEVDVCAKIATTSQETHDTCTSRACDDELVADSSPSTSRINRGRKDNDAAATLSSFVPTTRESRKRKRPDTAPTRILKTRKTQ